MIDFGNLFGTHVVFNLFFKAFAVIGGAMYLIYALVIKRQSVVMLRALEEAHAPFIKFVSYLQIAVAVILIILALTIL